MHPTGWSVKRALPQTLPSNACRRHSIQEFFSDVSPVVIPFESPEQINHASNVRGIVSVVKLKHSLNLVHNDLNTRNVMSDEFNNPAIVDFDSCKPVGTSMKGQKSFTAPWGGRNALNIRQWLFFPRTLLERKISSFMGSVLSHGESRTCIQCDSNGKMPYREGKNSSSCIDRIW